MPSRNSNRVLSLSARSVYLPSFSPFFRLRLSFILQSLPRPRQVNGISPYHTSSPCSLSLSYVRHALSSLLFLYEVRSSVLNTQTRNCQLVLAPRSTQWEWPRMWKARGGPLAMRECEMDTADGRLALARRGTTRQSQAWRT